MPVMFNEKTNEFHLYNKEISYIFNIMPNSQLGHLYFGKNVKQWRLCLTNLCFNDSSLKTMFLVLNKLKCYTYSCIYSSINIKFN